MENDTTKSKDEPTINGVARSDWFSINGDWLRMEDKGTETRYRLSSLVSYWGDEYSISLSFSDPVGCVMKTLFKENGEDGRELREALDDYFFENGERRHE